MKEFRWRQDAAGQWRPEWRPLGLGMVRLREFFQQVREQSFQGPIQLHFEHPPGGAEEGRRPLTGSPILVRDAMRRDLHQLRRALAP